MLTVADHLHVLFGSLNHRRHMLIILTVSKSLPMNDDLVQRIHQSLAIVALNVATGRLHLGRLVIGDVTGDLFALGPLLGLVALKPLLNAIGLVLEPLDLPLSVWAHARSCCLG